MNNLKNMVILKNVNSNLVDEAIVVFKENVKIKKESYLKYNSNDEEKSNFKDDMCVKEAELVISEYISKLNNNTEKEELLRKLKFLKIFNIALVITIIALAIV